MAKPNLSAKEVLEKFADNQTLKFRPTKFLSSKAGYLKITPNTIIVHSGRLWTKKRKTFEWKQIKEFGVNCYEKSNNILFLLSVLLKDTSSTYTSENCVGFNLKPEYSESLSYKLLEGIGNITRITGHKYVHETFDDSYGFEDEDLAYILNSCLKIYHLKNNEKVS